jgi:SAM-dependent methyltransferase
MSEQVHRSDPRVLDRRTLERDHRRLAALLQPGMAVLDVGCGTGAITIGIAGMVGPQGRVLGVDRDDSLLATARQERREAGNLSFEIGDVLSLPFVDCFDIVTAARTLQWVSRPDLAIRQMTRAAKPGGHIVVLDYNHYENTWHPAPPAAFRRFYAAFLDWRTANRWSNRMADLLPDLFESEALTGVRIHHDDEVAERGDPDFSAAAAIWGHVIDSIGPRIAPEQEIAAARESYRDYVGTTLQRQTLSMRTVSGRKPRPR